MGGDFLTRKPSTDIPIGTDDLFEMIEKEASKKFKTHPGSRLSEYKKEEPKLWYSTGVLSLDIVLGGGLAGGRVSVWYGEENVGKSTILYTAIAEAQKRHPVGWHDFHVIADPEQSARDAKKHMELLGVDTSRVYIIAPSGGVPMYAEDIFERIEWLLRKPELKGRIGIIGIDSVAALVSMEEGEKDKKWSKSARVGGIAPLLTRFLQIVVDNGLLEESGGHLFLLNQVRENIGDIWNPVRMVGGRKLRHVASQIIEVTRSLTDFKNPNYDGKENTGEAQFIGQRIKFRQVKSKVGGKLGATASVDFYYDKGLDLLLNEIQVAMQYGIVVQNGAWLLFIDTPTGEIVLKEQGMDRFKKALSDKETYAKFNYLLNYTVRGLEVKSVINDWEQIKQEEITIS